MIAITLPTVHLEGDGPHGLIVSAPPRNHPNVTLKIPLDGMWQTLGIFGTPQELLAFAAEIASVVTAHLDAHPPDEHGAASFGGFVMGPPAVTVDDVAQALTEVSGRQWTAVEVPAEDGER